VLTGLRGHLDRSDLDDLKRRLADADGEQVALVLPTLTPRDQALVFRLLPKDTALAVFESLMPVDQRELLEAMGREEVVGLLERLDGEDRTRLLDELPAKVAKRLIAKLDADTRAWVQTMLGYPPGSVTRLLSPAYVAVRSTATVAQALEAVRRSPLPTDRLGTVHVIDDQRRYLGQCSLAQLVRAHPDTAVSSLARSSDVVARATDDAAEAARALQRHNLDAIAVVDGERRLIGALTDDDAMDALDVDTTARMFGKAGIADPGHAIEVMRSERLTSGGILYPVRVRLAFLIVTLVGGLMVGGLIDRFEGTLSAVVALAIFIPLVMDMGGNVGTQSTTIFARGLALGHIDISCMWTYVWREVRVGLVMGVILGASGGAVAYLWQGAPNGIPLLGMAVGLSLCFSVVLACFLGFLLPWVLVKLGLDHAPGADPFITTIKDFTGLLVYFGLATWVFRLAG
jgi:magnesium transporter